MEFHGWICSHPMYEFEGWIFECGYMSGPWPLRKDLEPRKRAGRKFWKMFERFDALSDKAKSTYRIGGGCERF